jgi:hypothetical protein
VGQRAGRGVVVVLVRGDRDREVALQKGASAASALAFQLASTNLVWELGLVMWVLTERADHLHIAVDEQIVQFRSAGPTKVLVPSVAARRADRAPLRHR